MLVQVRDDGTTWLVQQHDHALLSGHIAMAWGSEAYARPDHHHLVVMAVSLHDVAWQVVDEFPLLNPDTRLPYNVVTYPQDQRAGFFSAGLDKAESIHPYAALVNSLHYTSFPFLANDVRFQKTEMARQARAREALARSNLFSAPIDDVAAEGLAFLQLMDRLSLYICNFAPGSVEGDWVPWAPFEDRDDVWTNWNMSLDDRVFERIPSRGTMGPLTLRWAAADRLTLDPFPLEREIAVEVPYRRLAHHELENLSQLREAWLAADSLVYRLTLAPGE